MSRRQHLAKYVCPTHPDSEPIDISVDVVCSECGLVLMRSFIADTQNGSGYENQSEAPTYKYNYTREESAIVYTHRRYVNEILGHMYLLDNVLQDAMYYFQEIALKNLRKQPTLKVSKSEFRPLSIACIALAVRRNKCGVRVKDILMFCERDIESKANGLYQRLLKHFNVKGQFQPEWFVERYCKSLFPVEVLKKPENSKKKSFQAEKLCHRFIIGTRRELRDREASCVSSLALYIASGLLGESYTLEDVINISGTTVETMKNQWRKIKNKLPKIFGDFKNFNFDSLFTTKVPARGRKRKKTVQ